MGLQYGKTALMMASERDHVEVVEKLMEKVAEKGSSMNVQDKVRGRQGGWRGMMKAMVAGDEEEGGEGGGKEGLGDSEGKRGQGRGQAGGMQVAGRWRRWGKEGRRGMARRGCHVNSLLPVSQDGSGDSELGETWYGSFLVLGATGSGKTTIIK